MMYSNAIACKVKIANFQFAKNFDFFLRILSVSFVSMYKSSFYGLGKIINLKNDLGCYLTLYEVLKASNMEISVEQQR